MLTPRRLVAGLAALMFCALPLSASAQSYPNKPVRLIIPYNPGGIVDYVGRVMANYLGKELEQPVIAENRPGAGGIVGTDVVAREQPDGYSLLIMDPAIVINPTLQKSVPYDIFKQLEAVSVISSSPEVLVVSPKLNVKTFDELIAYGKAHPGKLNFASAGIGTTPHLAGEMFMQRTGIEATHVPYKGIGASFTDMMSNKVQFAFSSIAGALPFTSDNRVIPLATTGEKRSSVYPNLPTVQEAGFKGFTVDLWLTIFAPKGLPADVRATLNRDIAKALASPELKAAFQKVGAEPRGTSTDAGAVFVKAEFDKWKKIIVDGKIERN